MRSVRTDRQRESRVKEWNALNFSHTETWVMSYKSNDSTSLMHSIRSMNIYFPILKALIFTLILNDFQQMLPLPHNLQYHCILRERFNLFPSDYKFRNCTSPVNSTVRLIYDVESVCLWVVTHTWWLCLLCPLKWSAWPLWQGWLSGHPGPGPGAQRSTAESDSTGSSKHSHLPANTDESISTILNVLQTLFLT